MSDEKAPKGMDDSLLKQMLETLPPMPNCGSSMQARFIGYEPGKSLTVAFPVLTEFLNPAGSMQGGYITAAFDNVFGPLSILLTGKHMVTTLDINTSYHRPIWQGDQLTITAHPAYLGRSRISMFATAFDNKGNIIATATSNMMVMKIKEHHPKKSEEENAKE